MKVIKFYIPTNVLSSGLFLARRKEIETRQTRRGTYLCRLCDPFRMLPVVATSSTSRSIVGRAMFDSRGYTNVQPMCRSCTIHLLGNSKMMVVSKETRPNEGEKVYSIFLHKSFDRRN